ncbi:hypothetical protein [Streptomyces sp. NPDC059994]|uniref:hypothetical protein n=1 Tax=Streptomyces sp. NPDC059994 TaxID=3347029 RepID=UPI0036A99BF7
MTATAVCPASSHEEVDAGPRQLDLAAELVGRGAGQLVRQELGVQAVPVLPVLLEAADRVAQPVGAICAGSTGNRLSRSWSSPRCAEVRRRSLRTARARRGSLRTRTRSAAASGPSTVPSRARRSRPGSYFRSASALRAARARRHPAS